MAPCEAVQGTLQGRGAPRPRRRRAHGVQPIGAICTCSGGREPCSAASVEELPRGRRARSMGSAGPRLCRPRSCPAAVIVPPVVSTPKKPT
eukprot:scaffold1169_cov367-Prasinococcus_capsulatus_cf.AAC.12